MAVNPNCYWIEEDGTFELCAGGELPPLTEGWIQFDTAPDNTGGRAENDTSYAADHPISAQAAYGNGVLVIAAAYRYGLPSGSNGTHFSLGVHTSDDHGFTYSGFIDKYPWQAGAGSFYAGYDPDAQFWGTFYYAGSKIAFDNSNFYTVDTTHNDSTDQALWYRTSKSSDGVNWTTSSPFAGDGGGSQITAIDALDGDLWFLGFNYYNKWYGDGDPLAYVVGYSANDGASWTETTLTVAGELNHNIAYDEYSAISADADGLHVMVQQYDYTGAGGFYFGMVYYRPLTNTTWATGQKMFDYDTPDYDDYGINLVASKNTAGLLLATATGYSGSYCTVYIRRSTDGGQNWAAQYGVNLPQPSDWWLVNEARNNLVLVELDGGKFVMVALYQRVSDSAKVVSFSQSTDGGISFSAWTELSVNEWIFDPVLNGQRIRAAAKGNDVIVTQQARDIAGNSLIFRP